MYKRNLENERTRENHRSKACYCETLYYDAARDIRFVFSIMVQIKTNVRGETSGEIISPYFLLFFSLILFPFHGLSSYFLLSSSVSYSVAFINSLGTANIVLPSEEHSI